jgi:FdhD protein
MNMALPSTQAAFCTHDNILRYNENQETALARSSGCRRSGTLSSWHEPGGIQVGDPYEFRGVHHMPVSDPTPVATDAAAMPVQVQRVTSAGLATLRDLLAVEEPLEVRLGYDLAGERAQRVLSVTMRTPGHDRDLAIGFLFTEGIVASPEQVISVHPCKSGNAIRVDLRPGVAFNLARLERHFYTTSSCGVCGKTSLEAVRICSGLSVPPGSVVDAEVIHRLPAGLRAAQAVFDRTGGLHASALFDTNGTLLCLREDVGRHNALDKLVGAQFLAGRTPLADSILLVSGRASFELVQKAVVAGIPILAALGAPSSLAVNLAEEHGMTILGFVRPESFNIYSGAQRIHRALELPLLCAKPESRLPLSMV